MLRGDVDRFYQALRREHTTPPAGRIGRLGNVRAIADYYNLLNQEERLLLLAWAKKEESGIGIIPLALSAIPFFGLIISARLQELLSRLPIWQVFLIWSVFGSLVITGFYIHQRQKAYTMLHIVLLEQAIKRREAVERRQPFPPPYWAEAHFASNVEPRTESEEESQLESQADPHTAPNQPNPNEDRPLTLPPAQGTH